MDNLAWIEQNFEERPYTNEHSARLVDPKIQHKRVRRTKGSGDGTVQGVKVPATIAVIWYIIESNGKEIPVAQALRFPIDTWSESEARNWLKTNKIKYLLFEPAEKTAKKSESMEKSEYRFGELRKIPKDVESTRTIQFVVSDETKDRHNSVIKSDGWRLENYEKNPIVGYQHQIYSGWSAPNPDNVIGTSKVFKDNGSLIADIQFEPEEINPLAEKIFRKILHGTIRATSVGFFPNKSHDGDPEKNEKEEKGIKYYDETELLEISVVNVPSNPNAVKRADDKEKIELIQYILSEALGDKFNEKLTVKGIFSILKGENEIKLPDQSFIFNSLLNRKLI